MEALPQALYQVYRTLHAHYGYEPRWWPTFSALPAFEIIVGAVLVQQTRWESVEACIRRLIAHELLSPVALAGAPIDELAELIRPCAFYRQKAPGLIRIAAYICDQYGADTTAFLKQPRATLRQELLALPRIGPETADAILIYAGGHAGGIVDAYTRRLFARLSLPGAVDWERSAYEQLRLLIEQAIQLWAIDPYLAHSQLHALITEVCVQHCLERRPRCDGPGLARAYTRQPERGFQPADHDGCPLRQQCRFYRQQLRDL